MSEPVLCILQVGSLAIYNASGMLVEDQKTISKENSLLHFTYIMYAEINDHRHIYTSILFIKTPPGAVDNPYYRRVNLHFQFHVKCYDFSK